MTGRRLPIGMQSFREVREEGCYYVAKTAYIGRLLDEGKHYFLSRPRRFGKSLFPDTCKELFAGHASLFEGLAIHERWDWSVRHPVLHLSSGSGHFQGPNNPRTEVDDPLWDLEDETGVTARRAGVAARLRHLIQTLHAGTGRRVAVLIDEYDKPVLDALETLVVGQRLRWAFGIALPAFPISGMRTTTLPTTRASTPASSIPTSPLWAWT